MVFALESRKSFGRVGKYGYTYFSRLPYLA